jgi:hypothetical protein
MPEVTYMADKMTEWQGNQENILQHHAFNTNPTYLGQSHYRKETLPDGWSRLYRGKGI